MSHDLEARQHRLQVTRLRPRRIVAVELWDLENGESTLWQTMHMADFPHQLFSVLEALRQGHGRCRWSQSPLPQCQGFSKLWLLGGGASSMSQLSTADRQVLACEVEILEGTETPASACQRLYDQGGNVQDGNETLVIDVGQSAIKVACRGHRRFDRDLALLPIRAPGSQDRAVDGRRYSIEGQRQRLRAFLVDSLRSVLETSDCRPTQVLMALPCELGDEPLPAGCSYIGMAEDATLVADVLIQADLAHLPCSLVNDAELAAMAVRQNVAHGDKHLVVTLGFAVGGALVLPESQP